MKPLKTLTLYEMMLDLMKEEEESIQQIRTSMREVTIAGGNGCGGHLCSGQMIKK